MFVPVVEAMIDDRMQITNAEDCLLGTVEGQDGRECLCYDRGKLVRKIADTLNIDEAKAELYYREHIKGYVNEIHGLAMMRRF